MGIDARQALRISAEHAVKGEACAALGLNSFANSEDFEVKIQSLSGKRMISIKYYLTLADAGHGKGHAATVR